MCQMLKNLAPIDEAAGHEGELIIDVAIQSCTLSLGNKSAKLSALAHTAFVKFAQ